MSPWKATQAIDHATPSVVTTEPLAHQVSFKGHLNTKEYFIRDLYFLAVPFFCWELVTFFVASVISYYFFNARSKAALATPSAMMLIKRLSMRWRCASLPACAGGLRSIFGKSFINFSDGFN